jgi:phenol hydroxylase P0 protein
MTTTDHSSVHANGFDTSRKFVRIRGERGDGFVEFEFAVGEAELFAELILQRSALIAFCEDNQVTLLQGDKAVKPGEEEWSWSLHDATTERFKSRL